ncbi:MAG: protein kinase [Acidobacteria bacterium]|nr:protein kinase [Acidobacteriota bacterium]
MSTNMGESNDSPDGGASGSAPVGPGCVLKDRYLIEKELGRGGFGVVYLARDQQLLSKPVVVKVLSEDTAKDPWVQKKFRQEMEALARIDHPGVVGALDVGEAPDGKPFLVMQFLEGVTLRSAISKGGMEIRRAGNIMRQVGQALSAAHEKGVYHRDLKPENIMLQKLGEDEEYARLIDFGIAAVRESQIPSNAPSSKIAGSFAYMAPEQLMGKASPSSDIYALGIITYEMLTGQRPEMSPTGAKVKPRELRPEIPEEAQQVILKALSFYPDERYQRPRDFGDQLGRALTGEGSSAHTPTPPQTVVAAPSDPSQPSSLEMAYVLFMDLVSYSTLPMDRQTELIQRLQETVRSTGEFRRAQASGQLISLPTGDGMALVFFQNPVAAVQSAVEISRALRNNPDIKLRMGVHAGPVYRIADINTNRNVAGGGINMAQRVMDCGDAGHILISKSVADVLSQLSNWARYLHDLGEQEVKHGVRVHLLNFYTDEVGNPQVPEKLRSVVTPPPPVAAPKSHRGVYMLLGSALTLVILVIAVTKVAEWRKPAAASVPGAGPAAGSPPEAGSPPPPGPVAGGTPPSAPPPGPGPAAQQPAPTQPAAGGPAATARPEAPAVRRAVPPAGEAAPALRKAPETNPSAAVEPRKVSTPPPTAQSAPPARQAPPDPALQELRERMILLAARVTAVRISLQNLQQQQSQSGLSLRSDMVAASQRVEYLMGEANAALAARDAVALKRNLDLAERDVEKLEGFLGR